MAKTKKAATANQEIEVQDIPEVAEQTVAQSESDETTNVSNQDQEEPEKKPSNLKRRKFYRKEAKIFCLDVKTKTSNKEEIQSFVNATIYKKFDFSFSCEAGIDLNNEKNKIVKNINRVLSIMKSVIEQKDVITDIHDSELRYNGVNTVYTVFIPFCEQLMKITQNFYGMIKTMQSESPNVYYRIKTKNMAIIHVEKDAPTDGFFKGFVAVAHENARIDKNTGKEFSPAKDYIKCGSYIDSAVGLTGEELSTFSRYNLTFNKMNLFNDDTKKKNEYNDFFLTFGKRFRVVNYELFYNAENKLCARTNLVTISLKSENVIQTSDQKVIDSALLSKIISTKQIEHLSDVFINDEGENILIKDMYLNPNSYEMQSFATEIDVIDRNIISSLNVNEETAGEAVETGSLADVVSEEQ